MQTLWEIQTVFDSNAEILAQDDAAQTMRVRQKAMRADSENGNRRIYPRAVVQDAIDRARPKAHDGVMISERRHPHVASIAGDDGQNADYYVDNPNLKTATVDDISPIMPDGWVYITRTIRANQPKGREVADAIKAGEPLGISTRFKMRGDTRRIGGRPVTVASYMDIHTWDDVDDPAFSDAGKLVPLTDSQIEELKETRSHLNASVSLFDELEGYDAGDALHTQEKPKTMEPKFQRALNTLFTLIARRASAQQVQAARQAACDAMEKVKDEDPDGDVDMTDYAEKMAKADAMATLAGYRSGNSPTVTNGNDTGTEDPGFAPDIKGVNPVEGGTGLTPTVAPDLHGDALTSTDIAYLRSQRIEAARSQREATVNAALTAAADENTVLAALKPEDKAYVISHVRTRAMHDDKLDIAAAMQAEADGFAALQARHELAAQGYNANARAAGQTVTDGGSPAFTTQRMPKWMEGVHKLVTASDDLREQNDTTFDKASLRRRRAHNMKFIDKMNEEAIARDAKYKTMEEKFLAEDALATGGEVALADCISRAALAHDNITLANMYNQPTISQALLMMAFQDLEFLQFAQGMGSADMEVKTGKGGFDPMGRGQEFGSVIRVPVEIYTAPGNYGVSGVNYDGGLAVPEGLGIDEATVSTYWLPYAATWRRIAISPTRDVIKAMGNGPLNYPVVARALFHIAFDMQRRIDRIMGDEMYNIPDETGCIATTDDTSIAATLTNNSAGINTGALTVNLNPAKTAITAVAATDQSVTYGANVVGAIRMKGRGAVSAAPYFGTVNGYDPVVRPQANIDLSNVGLLTPGTPWFNIVATSVGAAPTVATIGWLDDTGNIQTFPGGGATANCAIDYRNSVIVFTAALCGASPACFAATTGSLAILANNASRSFTVSYYTAVNFDNFVVNNITLPTGVTQEQYFSGLLTQVDKTAAYMGSSPRFVTPNLALSSLLASTNITPATIFYQLNSPEQTELYPTESYYASRNGVGFARHNAVAGYGNNRLLLTRRGSTKIAVDTAFELRGPVFPVDSNGKVKSRETYIGEQNSAIFTPQVRGVATDRSNILNPMSRTIILR